MKIEESITALVNYIENNFHEYIDTNKIEKITGMNYKKFSSMFKKICDINVKTYTKGRILTKIILEIKGKNINIAKANLQPYPSQNSFHEAFKNEFGITPGRFLVISCENKLYEKLDVDLLYSKYKKNNRVLNELINEYYGRKRCALNYLLSLNAYSITALDENFTHPLGLGYKLLNKRYTDEEGEFLSAKSLSVNRYIEEIEILEKFYDLNKYITFPQIHEWEMLVRRKYYLVNRQIVSKLMENIDYDTLKQILQVSRLKTIFLHFEGINKLSAISKSEEIMKYTYYYENKKKHNLDYADRIILKNICLQDIGINKYSNIDDFINSIEKYGCFEKEIIEKKIIKLIKNGLLYLDGSEYVDKIYENKLTKEFDKLDKERVKEIEKQEKNFINILKKIKKNIASISIERELTKVRYNYKAIKSISDIQNTDFIYQFRYKDENTHCIYNICVGSEIGNDHIELHFNLHNKERSKLKGKIKEEFDKKIISILNLINKEVKYEGYNNN